MVPVRVAFAFASLVIVAFLAGCADVGPSPGVAGRVTWERSTSMLPSFEGEGPSYALLTFHRHEGLSAAQKEEQRRNPVVCSDGLGAVVALVDGYGRSLPGPAADAAMAPCPGPPYDAATGRLLVDEAVFAGWKAAGVVVVGGCGSGLLPMGLGGGPSPSEVVLDTSGRPFRLELLPNGTYLVEAGQWLRPGEVLKGTYTMDHGPAEHDRDVQVVFDFAGPWLVSRVGIRPGDPLPPVRPLEGTGPEALVPAAPADVAAILQPVVDATVDARVASGLDVDAADVAFERIRIGLAGGGQPVLTDVAISVAAGGISTAWFVASTDGTEVRLLGADGQGFGYPGHGEVAWPELEAAFAGEPLATWLTGADAAYPATIEWRGNTTATRPAGLFVEAALGAMSPVPCDGACAFARSPLGAWGRVLAEAGEATGAATLVVTEFGDEPRETGLFFA